MNTKAFKALAALMVLGGASITFCQLGQLPVTAQQRPMRQEVQLIPQVVPITPVPIVITQSFTVLGSREIVTGEWGGLMVAAPHAGDLVEWNDKWGPLEVKEATITLTRVLIKVDDGQVTEESRKEMEKVGWKFQ
jgi:hypothetical protein